MSHRAQISAADPDKSFEATTAIGYLLRMLRDLAPDHGGRTLDAPRRTRPDG